jgi:hypothetical protein
MYRTLAIFPKSADQAVIGALTSKMVDHFRASPGFIRATVSVDALMGPSARSGDYGLVLEADFETLEEALGALKDDAAASERTAVESLEPMLLLFECQAA